MNVLRRVALGSLVYVVILVLAAPYPSAAGLMLTFPALNGLGLLYADQGSVSGMAKSMLWMPVVNGILCAGYIFLFLNLAAAFPKDWLAGILFTLVTIAWLAVVTRPVIRRGIRKEQQSRYALVVTMLGAMVLVVALSLGYGNQLPTESLLDAGIIETAWRTVSSNWFKITLFVVALSAFLILPGVINVSVEARGILAGLPLVPFGGLVSIAADHGRDVNERMTILQGMGVGVWLGPAVAIGFILFVSAVLEDQAFSPSAVANWWRRFGVVLLGWAGSGAAIATIVVLSIVAR